MVTFHGLLCVQLSGMINSCSLFWFSNQKKELVVVDVEMEPLAVLTIHIVQNKIHLVGSSSHALWNEGI